MFKLEKNSKSQGFLFLYSKPKQTRKQNKTKKNKQERTKQQQ